jgi:hypothetical protein
MSSSRLEVEDGDEAFVRFIVCIARPNLSAATFGGQIIRATVRYRTLIDRRVALDKHGSHDRWRFPRGGTAVTERTPDLRIIELEDPDELKYWVKFFETSRDELLAAISAVGTSAHDVKRYLDEKLAGS